MSPDLKNHTAIITGGASGIGRAGVGRFLAHGANVVAVDVDTDGLSALDHEERSSALLVTEGDVTDEASLERAFALARDTFGTIDIIWNNAGVEAIGPVASCTTDEYRRIFDVNVLGVLLGTKLGAIHVADGGLILNTASIAALSGIPMQVLYASSKAAVVSITRTAAIELATRRVRVNCLCPGIVDTPMIAKSLGGEVTPELLEVMASTNPFGRLIEPVEVANCALFLASESAGSVSGQALAVDGAMTAGPRLDIASMLA